MPKKRRAREELPEEAHPRVPVYVPAYMAAVPYNVPPTGHHAPPRAPQPAAPQAQAGGGSGVGAAGVGGLPQPLQQVVRLVEQQLLAMDASFTPAIVARVMQRVERELGSGRLESAEDAVMSAVSWCSQEAAPPPPPGGGGAGAGGDEDEQALERDIDLAREIALESAEAEKKKRAGEQRRQLIKCDLTSEGELKETDARGSSLLRVLRGHSGFVDAAAATVGCDEEGRGEKGKGSQALELKGNLVDLLLLEAKTKGWYGEYATAFIRETAEQLELIFNPRGGRGGGEGRSSSGGALQRQATDVKNLYVEWSKGVCLGATGQIPKIICDADKRAKAAAPPPEGVSLSQDGDGVTEISGSVQVQETEGVVVID